MVRFVYDFSDDSIGLKERLGRAAFASLAGLAHFTNTGMVSNAVFQSANTTPVPGVAGDGRAAAGLPQSEEERRLVAQTIDTAAAQPVIRPTPFVPGNYRLVADLVPKARDQGVSLAYVVTPRLQDLATAPDYPATIHLPNGVSVPVFNLARPDRYPELYRSEYWRNPGHLSAAGAVVFSRLFAREVRAWMDRGGAITSRGN
jgi:hypothetical protein